VQKRRKHIKISNTALQSTRRIGHWERLKRSCYCKFVFLKSAELSQRLVDEQIASIRFGYYYCKFVKSFNKMY